MSDGFIIGSSVDTATPPTAYWSNSGAFAPEIDTAEFYTTLATARSQAGQLQSTYVTEHIEAYGASLNVVHNPALGTGGI